MAFFKRRKSPFAHEIDRFHAPPVPARRFSLRKERRPRARGREHGVAT